jgi:hypothetical protein
MEYWLFIDFNANNNGLELETHWIGLAIPTRTILIILAIWLGRKAYRKIRQNRGK